MLNLLVYAKKCNSTQLTFYDASCNHINAHICYCLVAQLFMKEK